MKDKKEKTSLVKMDNSFLEYPNWLIDSKSKIKTLEIETDHGTYKISTTDDVDRLPDRVDKIILYYLLTYRTRDIEITRYRISQDIFERRSPDYYAKIMQALKRWVSITIEFNGTFVKDGEHVSCFYHILESAVLQKDGSLQVCFNDKFLIQLDQTNFYKYIDVNEFKKLRRPVSAMLYEHLIKQFKGRDFWKIGIVKLAKKLTMSIRYPSDILLKLKPAVNEINKNTNFKFTMDYDEDRKICLFRLLEKDAKVDQTTDDSMELTRLLALLPEALKSQRSVKALLEGYHKEKGYQFVQSNIIYALQNSKKNMKAYLKQALLNDYGEEVRSNIVAEEEQRRRNKAIEETLAKKEADEKELWNQVRSWIEKHGGIGKARYHGGIVIACSPSVGGMVVETDDGRKAVPLEEVKEKGFGKSSK